MIRVGETARTAIHTALTGHLVFSTLHTTSALEAVLRLADMGVERYLIGATLRLIVGQRLVRTVCRSCDGADPDCAACRGTGMSGRSVIAEVLEADAGFRERISRSEPLEALREHCISRGFRPMADDAAEKVDWGVTTDEEVLKALCS